MVLIQRYAAIATTLLFWAAPAFAAEEVETVEFERMFQSGPESAELGEHGVLVLEGDLNTQGAISNLVVTTSTGSPSLDERARVRLEGGNVPESSKPDNQARIRIKIEFINFILNDSEPLRYSCEQAVRDADWSSMILPKRNVEDEFLYGALQVMGLVLGTPGLEFASDSDVFKQAWIDALDGCRNNPDQQFMAALGHFGRLRASETNDAQP